MPFSGQVCPKISASSKLYSFWTAASLWAVLYECVVSGHEVAAKERVPVVHELTEFHLYSVVEVNQNDVLIMYLMYYLWNQTYSSFLCSALSSSCFSYRAKWSSWPWASYLNVAKGTVSRLTKSILFCVWCLCKQSCYCKYCDFTQLLHAIRVLGGVLDKPGHKLKLIIVCQLGAHDYVQPSIFEVEGN